MLEEAINFYVGESKDRITKDFGEALEKGAGFDGLYKFKSRDGVLKWVRSIGIPKRSSDGTVKEVHGVFQDVTKVKQFEETIEAYDRRLELALAASDIGVWEFDLSNGSLSWDERMFRIYGKSHKDFNGNVEDWNDSVHPDDFENAQKDLQDALMINGVFKSEFRIVRPDGAIRFIKARSQAISDEKGQVTRTVGVNWDITETKKNAELLRAEKEKAEQASKAKSTFLSHMSHEIRTPMNGMLGYLSLLSETRLDGEQKGFVETILESASSLHAIINDILDYSKIEAGKMTLSCSVVPINRLIEQVCSLFRATISAKGVWLKSHVDLIEGAAAYLDEVRVKQILSNIIGNAAKFTNKGEVAVSVTYEQSKELLIFDICDTGIGIDSEQITRIFEPFEQSDHQVVKGHQGTGLGLAIVGQLANLMGGDISCKSSLGKGSQFTLRIPTKISVVKDQSFDLQNEQLKFKSFDDKRVLVVDDVATNRTLVKLRLEKIGIYCDMAESGEKAIAKIKDHNKYDLIFMDINMPGTDGYMAAKTINQILKEDCPPIYALTANAFEEDVQRSMENGMTGHISKPIRKQDLYAVLEGVKIIQSIK